MTVASETERNKRIARLLVEATGPSRSEVLRRHMTDDATWWIGGSTPLSGAHRFDDFSALTRRLFAGVSGPRRLVLTSITAEGDRVCLEAEGHAVFGDGRVYANQVLMLIRFRDGKIASIREYGDTEHLARLFGGDRILA